MGRTSETRERGSSRHEVDETLAAARLVVALAYAYLVVRNASTLRAADAALVAYVVYAAGVCLALRWRLTIGRATQVALHAADLAVPIGLTVALAEPIVVPGVLYLVPLVGAALRWGAGAALASMSLAIAFVLLPAGHPRFSEPGPDTVAAELIVGGSILTFVGLLGQRRRHETRAIGDLRDRCGTARSFRGSLLLLLEGLTTVCDAKVARVVAVDTRDGRTFAWDYTRGAAPDRALRCTELVGAPRALALAGEATAQRLTAGFHAGEWSGRVELLEPRSRHVSLRPGPFLGRAVRELTPTLYDRYLASHRRSRATEEARTRLARALHDGPIQSLIGAEMHIAALCRQVDPDRTAKHAGVELRRAQDILRQEILALRELMMHLKPLDVTPEELPEYLSQIVRRFSRDTGIRGEFIADGSRLDPARQHCAELARIVQEALSNVRKHSGATHVRVSLRSSDDGLGLIVHDNGRGFAFDGIVAVTPSSTAQSLPVNMPAAIMDSVRALGGRLVIDSNRGRGARLEIVVPSIGSRVTPVSHQVAS